jgi:hypothetical protein
VRAAAQAIDRNWVEQLPEEARACASVTNDFDSARRTCPACLSVFDAGPTHCPSCRLFIGG